MSFVSLDFAIVFPVVFLVSWILRQWPGPWRIWLAAASMAFFAVWSPTMLGLLVGLGLLNHLSAVAIEHLGRLRVGPTRALVAIAVVGNVGTIAVFRYYGAIVDDLVEFALDLGFVLSTPVASTAIPLGLSFFALNGLGYVIDVYRGDLAPMRPLDAAVHLTYVPALVAGPLVRPDELVPELRRVHDRPRIDLARGLRLLVGGILKLIAIAPFIGQRLVDPVFADPAAHSGLVILVAVYALAFQMYAIFSGATDLATGLSELLGIRLPRSFDAPYRATSVSDFWLRWNATITRWFRDYVFAPLSRGRNMGAAVFGTIAASLLVALWFDVGVTVLVWGLVHGLLLTFERLVVSIARKTPFASLAGHRLLSVPRWLYAFHAVCLAWIPFRADSLATAQAVVAGLATPGTFTLLSVSAAVAVAVMVVAHAIPEARTIATVANLVRPGPAFQGAIFAVGTTIALAFAPDSLNPFPYLGL